MGHDGPGHVAIADGRPVAARAEALPRQGGRRALGRDEGAPRAGHDPRPHADRRRAAEAARRRGRVDRRADVPDRQHELAASASRAARPRSWTPGAPRARRTTSRSASAIARPTSAASRRCSSSSWRWSSEPPGRVRGDRPRRRERARACAAGWPAAASSSSEVNRFPNRPVRLPDGLRWNLLALFTEALDGLRAAAAEATLRSVGVDTWGVDYALLDARGPRARPALPLPRRAHRRAWSSARTRASRATSCTRATGIQTMPINTVFQLLADEDGGGARRAPRASRSCPTCSRCWLSGELANEAHDRLHDRPARRAQRALGGRADRAARAAGAASSASWSSPARCSARCSPHHELGDVAGLRRRRATTRPRPSSPRRCATAARAVLSSGTWSLLGLELDEPVLDERRASFNLTNERGVDGTTRLLRNVMGLWLRAGVPPRAASRRARASYEDLLRAGRGGQRRRAAVRPRRRGLPAPGDMPARIASACERAGQRAPAVDRRARPQHPRLARLQVPARARAASSA